MGGSNFNRFTGCPVSEEVFWDDDSLFFSNRSNPDGVSKILPSQKKVINPNNASTFGAPIEQLVCREGGGRALALNYITHWIGQTLRRTPGFAHTGKGFDETRGVFVPTQNDFSDMSTFRNMSARGQRYRHR